MVDTLTGRRGLEDTGDEHGPSGHFPGLCYIQDIPGHNLRNCLQHRYNQLQSVSVSALIACLHFLINSYQCYVKIF